MIGADTNVLLRLFVVDDPKQSEMARTFFASRSPADPAFLSLVAIVELVWLLRDGYEFEYAATVEALFKLLSSPDFVIERRDLVAEAVALAGERKIDFADYFIAGVSIEAGCSSVVTFDQPASRRVPGMELLK